MMPIALKRVLFAVLALLCVVALAVGGYIAYLSATYYRIPDKQTLSVDGNPSSLVETGTSYTAVTYNIGFGAYTPDYSFFMGEGVMQDGTKTVGVHSRAVSKESCQACTDGDIALISGLNSNFILLQEVDTNSDRSFHINQASIIQSSFPGYGMVFASNFHTAFLPYPLTEMIGSINSGLVTLTDKRVSSAERRSYPVDESFPTKFFDLDRCFEVVRLPVEGSDHELVLINSHMSAYDEGGKIRQQQLALLQEVLDTEAKAGNWVIAGGDWNHALCGSQDMYASKQQIASWVAVLDESELPEGFSVVRADNIEEVATCRGSDIPYEKGTTYEVTIDGFIVSGNVTASAHNVDNGYAYSDHNPVQLTFVLNDSSPQ